MARYERKTRSNSTNPIPIKKENVLKHLKLKWKNFEINNVNIETLDPKMNMTKFEYLKKARTSYNLID